MPNNKKEQRHSVAEYLYDDFTCWFKSMTKCVGTGNEADLAEDTAQLTRKSGGLSLINVTDPNVLSVIRDTRKVYSFIEKNGIMACV